MPSYVPNAFAGQAATAGALRSYAPNRAPAGPPATTNMAPHLSTPEADRPYAEDIALLQGSPQYASAVPKNLDKMWRYSPNTYEAKVAALLRQPGAAGALESLRNPPTPVGATRQVEGEDGTVTQVWNGEGWVRPRRGSDGD